MSVNIKELANDSGVNDVPEVERLLVLAKTINSVEIELRSNAPDPKKMFLRPTEDIKQHYCSFCKKKVSRFGRHLAVHKNVPEVAAILKMKKKSDERKKAIERLRKTNDLIWTTDPSVNDGELIVLRRPNKEKLDEISEETTTTEETLAEKELSNENQGDHTIDEKVSDKEDNENEDKDAIEASDYTLCPDCKGFIRITNVRHHIKECCKSECLLKKSGSVMPISRMMAGRIHKYANDTVKRDIFPYLREDEITSAIRYEELVILYANELAEKFPSQEDHAMIRQKLRMIGRFIIAAKRIALLEEQDELLGSTTNDGTTYEVPNFMSLFLPKNVQLVVKTVYEVAGYDQNGRSFAAPSTAVAIGTALKYIAEFLITVFIQREDSVNEKQTKNFIKLANKEFEIINRIASETLAKRKRNKILSLPTCEDTDKITVYLENKRKTAHDLL